MGGKCPGLEGAGLVGAIPTAALCGPRTLRTVTSLQSSLITVKNPDELDNVVTTYIFHQASLGLLRPLLRRMTSRFRSAGLVAW